MLKYLGFGIVVAGIAILIGLLAGSGWDSVFAIACLISIIGIVLSGLFLGAFIGGGRSSANEREAKKDRRRKTKMGTDTVLITIPNIILAIILIFVI
ncbi:DUF5316 family protein [Salipaludibacillus sp. CF4.18]|uniref:DUF5316 family protein n=1 Tax=Salipaludibacillus sp. CF4.18 TaxID=3373081 RepID=UPI003EE7ABCF